VHLDQPVVVGDGAVDDEEDEVLVVVELRPLPEVLRVLDRERMEPEHVAQDPEALLLRPVEVDLEEAAAREQALDVLAAQVQLADLLLVETWQVEVPGIATIFSAAALHMLAAMRVPYLELSAMASVEAHRKNVYRPPYYVHKWWARRTGSVFRGLLLDLLLPPEDDVMQAFYRRHDFSELTILDPFMGGGTTVGEALRLGCKVVGCDLNPVAWFLVRQAMRDVERAALTAAYVEVEDEAAERIGSMYATTCTGCGSPARAQYVAWVKQVPCSGCGSPADLHLSQVVMADMATKGAGLVDCPACGHPWWVPSVREEAACPQ